MDKREKDKSLLKRINISVFLLLFCPSASPVSLLSTTSICLSFTSPLVLIPHTLPLPPPLRSLRLHPHLPSHPSLAPTPTPLSKSVAVSFPSTGTTSRRCSLDHRGMAFWEQPSYARCITNEFRYLQQSVGAKSAPSHSLCFQCIINYLPCVFPHHPPHSHHTVAKD